MAHEQQKPVADVAASGSYAYFVSFIIMQRNNNFLTSFIVIRTRSSILSLSLGGITITRGVDLVESILLHASFDRIGQSGNVRFVEFKDRYSLFHKIIID